MGIVAKVFAVSCNLFFKHAFDQAHIRRSHCPPLHQWFHVADSISFLGSLMSISTLDIRKYPDIRISR